MDAVPSRASKSTIRRVTAAKSWPRRWPVAGTRFTTEVRTMPDPIVTPIPPDPNQPVMIDVAAVQAEVKDLLATLDEMKTAQDAAAAEYATYQKAVDDANTSIAAAQAKYATAKDLKTAAEAKFVAELNYFQKVVLNQAKDEIDPTPDAPPPPVILPSSAA